MRATSLPVNTVVIVVIAVLVLVAVVALFYTGFFTSKETVSTQAAFSTACMRLLNDNCKTDTSDIQVPKFDADKDGQIDELARFGDNLFMICVNYYQVRCSGQIPGDINGDCIVGAGSDDMGAFQSICGPYWSGLPSNPVPPPDILALCDVGGGTPPGGGSTCGFPDGELNIFDILCVNYYWTTTESTAEVTCKELCNCL